MGRPSSMAASSLEKLSPRKSEREMQSMTNRKRGVCPEGNDCCARSPARRAAAMSDSASPRRMCTNAP